MTTVVIARFNSGMPLGMPHEGDDQLGTRIPSRTPKLNKSYEKLNIAGVNFSVKYFLKKERPTSCDVGRLCAGFGGGPAPRQPLKLEAAEPDWLPLVVGPVFNAVSRTGVVLGPRWPSRQDLVGGG